MAEAQVQPAAHEDAKADTRTAAKWLIAAFASVGTFLVAGLGLNAIGHLEGERLIIALVSAGVGVSGVIFAVYLITEVLAPTPMTLADVARFERNRNLHLEEERHDELVAYLEADPTFLQGIIDIEAVPHSWLLTKASRRYRQVVSERFRTSEAVWKAKEKELDSVAIERAEKKARTANARANTVHATVRRLENIISAQQTVFAFRECRVELVTAAVIVACGIGFFAAASNPPEAQTADLRGAVLKKVDLSGSSLRGANLEDMTLEETNFEGTNLEGAQIKGASWKGATCPDGTDSDNAGGTCAGHLDPG